MSVVRAVRDAFVVRCRSQAVPGVKVLVIRGIPSVKINAEIGQQILSDLAPVLWIYKGLRAAVADPEFAIDGVLVSFRVPTKVIMIVQDQNLLILPVLLPVIVGRRESADPATNNYEIELFTQSGNRPEVRFTIDRHGVGVRVRSRMTAAQPRSSWRIVRRIIRFQCISRRGTFRKNCSACGDECSIDKVSSG